MKNFLTILVLAMATTAALNAQTNCNGNNSVCYDNGYEQGYADAVNNGWTCAEDSLQAVINALQADLAECDSVAQAEVEYWMDNYYGAVAQGNALVDSLQSELTAAQECCSSCPAAIETAVDNAQAQAAEDLLPVLEALADAQECCSSCPAAIELAVDNAYDYGYADGLEDCEPTVTGLTDIDGTLIPVIGYYNELGQVVDPRTYTGLIIRKHADGTSSKYLNGQF